MVRGLLNCTKLRRSQRRHTAYLPQDNDDGVGQRPRLAMPGLGQTVQLDSELLTDLKLAGSTQ